MNVEVTAIGETMWIAETVAETATASTTAGATFVMQDSSGATYSSGTTTKSFTRTSGGTVDGNFIRIDEGATATFKLVVTLDAAASGQYRAQFVSAGFNATSAAAPTTAAAATPASDFRTGFQLISN